MEFKGTKGELELTTRMLEMLSSCKLVFDRMELQEPIGLTELIKEATEI